MNSVATTRDAVVFDLFHTLVNTEHLRPTGFDAVSEVAQLVSVDHADLARFWTATYADWETTQVRLVDLVVRYCEQQGLPVTVDDQARIDELFGVCKDDALRFPQWKIVDLVASLATATRLGVLSNCHEREVRCWDESPLADHVAVFGRSCRIGVMKPDPRSYRWVLDRLGVDAGRATYVGNGSSGELDGARAAGFGTVVHRNIFDAHNGLVASDEQRRRAAVADISVDTIDDLWCLLEP